MDRHGAKVAGIKSDMRISSDGLARRLALFSFSEKDRAALGRLTAWLAKGNPARIGNLLTELWESLDPGLGVLAGFNPQALVQRATTYISQLLSGRYDDVYAENRILLGILHHESQVMPERYTGMIFQLVQRILSEFQNETCGDGDWDVATAVHKIMLFDVTLVLESYAHAEHESIEYLALHDTLTGLPNHNCLSETLEQLLRHCDSEHPITLLFVGLSRFKAVNETLGHQVGDIILKETANRLTGMFPKRRWVSRLGGDIFVVLLPNYSLDRAEQLSTEILNELNKPLVLAEFSVDMAVTIGGAFTDNDQGTVSSLMSRAEMALYHAKTRNQSFTFFADEMKRYSLTQLTIGADLRRAIEQDELVLFYQPKIRLMDNRVVGAEALIRWLHPMRGLIPPALFIPAAEESVLIHPLTDWVLNAALTQAVRWRQQGLSWEMSVNLSAANLQNQELPERLEQLLSLHGVDPESLKLEITESALMADPARALKTVTFIRNMGIKLSIDDFGTGYSSLAYLKDLPVDEVKVDQVFVFGMRENEKDARIVRATVNLGHSLGLSVAAEGVEDEATLNQLREIGCDTAQGYFIAKPMPADELPEWLSRYGVL